MDHLSKEDLISDIEALVLRKDAHKYLEVMTYWRKYFEGDNNFKADFVIKK